MQIREFSL